MSGAARRALLVGLGTYAVLTALSFGVGESYAAAWLPLLKLESQWLSIGGFVCDSLTLVTRDAQHLVQLHLVAATEMTLENVPIPAGAALRSTTLQAYVLCHPVLVYTVLAAWPVAAWRQRVALLLLGIPCVLVTTSLDIPFVLSGIARRFIFDEIAPGRADRDPLVLYSDFVHGGGRLGLAILAALIAAVFVTRSRPAKLYAYDDARPTQKQAPQLHVVSTKSSPR